jgi:putative Ca2+/H+ antiporter (TMEM165/GDT1 family)
MSAPAVSAVVLQSGSDWPGVEGSVLLLGIILLAGLGTGSLFVVSALAYRQRRSRRYLLITVAIGALFLRSLVGVGTVLGYTPMVVHHLVEHTFDFLIAAIVLYAVFRSKPATLNRQTTGLRTESGDRHGEQ